MRLGYFSVGSAVVGSSVVVGSAVVGSTVVVGATVVVGSVEGTNVDGVSFVLRSTVTVAVDSLL